MASKKCMKQEVKNACLITRKDVENKVQKMVLRAIDDELMDLAQDEITDMINDAIKLVRKDKEFKAILNKKIKEILMQELPKQIDGLVKDGEIRIDF